MQSITLINQAIDQSINQSINKTENHEQYQYHYQSLSFLANFRRLLKTEHCARSYGPSACIYLYIGVAIPCLWLAYIRHVPILIATRASDSLAMYDALNYDLYFFLYLCEYRIVKWWLISSFMFHVVCGR